MYKIILSYDIQNEKGESVLKDHIPNAASYPLTKEDATEFNSSIAQDRLAVFLTHFLATGFLPEQNYRKRRGVIPEVRECNYTISFPLEPLALLYHHSNTRVDSNINRGEEQVLPFESVVKSFQDD